MKFVYIADFFYGETNGGAEQNDFVLLKLLRERGHQVKEKKSDKVTIDFLKEHRNKNYKFIVSNFVFMFNRMKDELSREGYDVVKIEHDHQYLLTRNPADYEDYKAPKGDLVSVDFYKNAEAVLCQSSFHEGIIQKNLKGVNTINVSGNLWREETLDLLEELSEKEKKEKVSIMKSQTAHKNTKGVVKYCEHNELEYDLIPPQSHHGFLRAMSDNGIFIFLPKTPETLSRLLVEARMMNMKVITGTNSGCVYEDWYKDLKGKDLIEEMRKRRQDIPDIIEEIFL